jgi:hypothetical protein
VNRLPQEEHSPVRFPFSSVVKESGAPHCRHGREREAPSPPAISRRRGRSNGAERSAEPRGGGLPSGTNTVVVSHSAQATSSFPSSPAVTVRTPPQSAHSGPIGDPGAGAPAGAPSTAAPVPIGSDPSIKVVTRWQSEHVPVSTRASCAV